MTNRIRWKWGDSIQRDSFEQKRSISPAESFATILAVAVSTTQRSGGDDDEEGALQAQQKKACYDS